MENSNLSLVYVNAVGINAQGFNEYEFFFSETPETVWGGDWNIECPGACSDLLPDETMYSLIERLETDIPLRCSQDNCCFSMADVQDGILALAFENISEYEIYPEPYRIIFKYGEKYDKVIEILSGRELEFKKQD